MIRKILKVLANAFRRIRGAIQQLLKPSEPTPSNSFPGVSSDSNQPSSNKQPTTEIDPELDTKPNVASATPKLPAEKPENTQKPDSLQDATPTTPAGTTPRKQDKKPPDRTGARTKSSTPKKPPTQRTTPESKPELICREIDGRGAILLSMPQEKNADVFQGKSRLSSNNGEYLLPDYTEEIRWAESEKTETIKLSGDTHPLIFKLRKNWKGDGRRVKHISNGCYVVFALRECSRKAKPPSEPLQCQDDKFLAHFFYSGGNDKSDGFDKCPSLFSRNRFSLDGNRVEDDHDMGDLFVGNPVQLNDTEDWRGVPWIRVGEEGGGKWGRNFKPDELDKNFLKVLRNREGWFYIRFFDEGVELIHSIDFRYLANLKKILIDGESHSLKKVIAPGINGHVPTTVQFVGKINAKSNDARITVDDDNTSVITPSPESDKTEWTLTGDGKGAVKAAVHLPRIWWSLNKIADKQSEWQDTAFQMSRDKFRKNRNATITVRLPVAVKEIFVGFNTPNQNEGARKYRAKYSRETNIRQAKFCLRDFCDHREISDRLHEESVLRVWYGSENFPLIHVPADTPPSKPTPEADVQQLPGVSLRPTTRNKRFSHAELEESRLAESDARRLRIAVDRRRKTKYRVNIETLRKLQG